MEVKQASQSVEQQDMILIVGMPETLKQVARAYVTEELEAINKLLSQKGGMH